MGLGMVRMTFKDTSGSTLDLTLNLAQVIAVEAYTSVAASDEVRYTLLMANGTNYRLDKAQYDWLLSQISPMVYSKSKSS